MITNRTKLLRSTVLCAGSLAMMLRAMLYATAIDRKGLLIAGHWSTWAILILTGLVLVSLFLTARKHQGPTDYARCFPRSFLQGAVSLLVACVFFQRSLALYTVAGDRLHQIAILSGFLAALALLVIGICRMLSKKPFFLCHGIISIFFALQLINQYRRWSADPQLMDYCFYLLALICLMFTAYFLAGFDVNMRSHKGLIFFSLAATYFCCLALPESGDTPLLIFGALWAYTCAPRIQPAPSEEALHENP